MKNALTNILGKTSFVPNKEIMGKTDPIAVLLANTFGKPVIDRPLAISAHSKKIQPKAIEITEKFLTDNSIAYIPAATSQNWGHRSSNPWDAAKNLAKNLASDKVIVAPLSDSGGSSAELVPHLQHQLAANNFKGSDNVSLVSFSTDSFMPFLLPYMRHLNMPPLYMLAITSNVLANNEEVTKWAKDNNIPGMTKTTFESALAVLKNEAHAVAIKLKPLNGQAHTLNSSDIHFCGGNAAVINQNANLLKNLPRNKKIFFYLEDFMMLHHVDRQIHMALEHISQLPKEMIGGVVFGFMAMPSEDRALFSETLKEYAKMYDFPFLSMNDYAGHGPINGPFANGPAVIYREGDDLYLLSGFSKANNISLDLLNGINPSNQVTKPQLVKDLEKANSR